MNFSILYHSSNRESSPDSADLPNTLDFFEEFAIIFTRTTDKT